MMISVKKGLAALGLTAAALLLGAAITAIPTSAAELPLPTAPASLDNNREPYMIEGELEFMPPGDQSDITDYSIYLLDGDGTRLNHVGNVNVKEQEEIKAFRRSIGLKIDRYGFSIKGLVIPETAVKFGIYPKNASMENENGLTFPIWDNPRHFIQSSLSFADNNKRKGKLQAELKWKGIKDESQIGGYKIYYRADGTRKELTNAAFDVPKGQAEYTIEIAEGQLPERASEITVYAATSEGEESPGVAMAYVTDDISEEPIVSLTPTSSIPVPVISDVADTDDHPGIFGGFVRFKAEDEKFDPGNLATGASSLSYGVYFLDGGKQKLKGIASIARDTSRYGSYTVAIPAGTPIPKGAVYIGVFAQMATAEGVVFGEKTFWDRPYERFQPKQVKFTDDDPNPGSVKGKVSWQAADDEAPLYGYSIYIDWNKDSKPYTTVKKGQATYEYVFPEGALQGRNHLIYVLPVNELGERPSDMQRQVPPSTFVSVIDASGSEKASLKPTGLTIHDVNKGWFVDTDDRPGLIGGKLNFPQANERAAAYEFYYIDALTKEINSLAEIECTLNGPQNPCGYPLNMPAGTPIPEGALFIGVRAKLADGSIKQLGGAVIKDKSTGNKKTFGDVPEDHIFKREIEAIASLDLISGYEDGSFGLDKPVTRAEFAAMLVRTLRLAKRGGEIASFSDVGSGDWFSDSVATAVEYKLLGGYEDGTFRPLQPISRKEIAIMVYNAYKLALNPVQHLNAYIEYNDNYEIPEWSRDAVSALKRMSILPRMSHFEPDKQVSRAESAFLLYRLLENYNLVERLKR